MNNNELGAKLAKETLTGDIAAFLIDRLRQFPKPYQQMSEKEKEQGEQIEMAKTAARELVSKAVGIVASGGRKTVQAELGKITVDKGLKCEIKASVAYADNLAKAALDACNGIIWRDDALICSLLVKKRYAAYPCLEIKVAPEEMALFEKLKTC